MKVKCPDCDFVAVHPTNYAKALLGRHRAKEHGYVSPTAKYRKAEKPRTSEVSQPKVIDSSVEPTRTPNFCPDCGCNLRAVTAALNLRRKM